MVLFLIVREQTGGTRAVSSAASDGYKRQVTGIAGPTGGSEDKPVGTVWFGWCVGGQCSTERQLFAGDRASVRTQSAQHALAGLLARVRAVAD